MTDDDVVTGLEGAQEAFNTWVDNHTTVDRSMREVFYFGYLNGRKYEYDASMARREQSTSDIPDGL